jgi:hypothetical protein
MKPEFSRQIFEKNNQIPNSIKIRPEEAELFHADGETDRPTWRFSNSKDIRYKTCVVIFFTTFV